MLLRPLGTNALWLVCSGQAAKSSLPEGGGGLRGAFLLRCVFGVVTINARFFWVEFAVVVTGGWLPGASPSAQRGGDRAEKGVLLAPAEFHRVTRCLPHTGKPGLCSAERGRAGAVQRPTGLGRGNYDGTAGGHFAPSLVSLGSTDCFMFPEVCTSSDFLEFSISHFKW